MKKLLFLVALFFAVNVFAAEKGTWTGYISDDHCGAKGAGHESCAKQCVKEGHIPIFVVGDKIYKIKDTKKVAKYVGDKVTITGTITDDTIDIDKVKK